MGTGKSSLGNCLLGQNNFEAKRSARAVTAKLTVGSTCATLREQLRHHQQQQRGDSCTAAAHTSDVDAVSTTPAASVVPPPPFSPWSAQAPVPQQQQQPQRPLVVVDSPGFGDPSRSTTALLNEIKVAAPCDTQGRAHVHVGQHVYSFFFLAFLPLHFGFEPHAFRFYYYLACLTSLSGSPIF